MAVNAVLCLAVGGLAHFGTVCMSFCWVNSGAHQRSAMFWHGNEDLPYVREGSQLCSVTIALSMFTMCRGGMVTVENPVNSRLEMRKDFQFFIKWVKLRYSVDLKRTTVPLGDFGAATKKPVWIYSPRDFSQALAETAAAPGTASSTAPAPGTASSSTASGSAAGPAHGPTCYQHSGFSQVFHFPTV